MRRLEFGFAVVAALALLITTTAGMALASGEPTAMSIGAPESAWLGQEVTLQVLLVGSDGRPVPNAEVLFVAPANFMGVSADAFLGKATTDKEGLAVMRLRVTQAGRFTLQAEFRGDDRFAPSQASTVIAVEGDAQLYAEGAGVHLPGINTPPPLAPSLFASLGPAATVATGLWPSLSGWPIALVLLVVWGLYAFAVAMTFKVVRSGAAAE